MRDRKKPDRLLIGRMKAIMKRYRIGWNECRNRFFHCPWCTRMLWKVIKDGPRSMVLCMYCKKPFLAWQVVSFWLSREMELMERERAKRREMEDTKRQLDAMKDSGKQFGFTKNGLPFYRFKDDSPSD